MLIVNPEVTNEHLVTKKSQLVDIESEIIKTYGMMLKGWLYIGTKLLEVEKHQLYKQHNYETFTPWLKYLSKSLGLRPSTLWKYLEVVKMIDDINLPFSDVNLKNITGLEIIARVYEHKGDTQEALTLIKQLDEKNITVAGLKKQASELFNLKPPASDKNNNPAPKGFLKAFWKKITKGFLAYIPQKPMLRMLPVLFVVFYITDMS